MAHPAFVTTEVSARALKNHQHEQELRVAWEQWAYLVYTSNEIDAERAYQRLLDCLETLHSSARVLVAQTAPLSGRHQAIRRSLSPDERSELPG